MATAPLEHTSIPLVTKHPTVAVVAEDGPAVVPAPPPLSHLIPAPSATPEEVRAYLERRLLAHGQDQEQARTLAAKWTRGTGQDLRTCGPRRYRIAFGEQGRDLYSDVMMEYYGVERGGRRHSRRHKIFAFWVLIVVTGIVLATTVSPDGPALGSVFIVMGGMAVVFASCCFCPPQKRNYPPRARVESDIEHAWDRDDD